MPSRDADVEIDSGSDKAWHLSFSPVRVRRAVRKIDSRLFGEREVVNAPQCNGAADSD